MAQEQSSLTQLLVALSVLLVLAGCSAAPQRPSSPLLTSPNPPPATPQSRIPPPLGAPSPRPPSPTRENHLSPATLALFTQAKTLLSRGDMDGASSTLARALRIEPNNPLLGMAQAVESQPFMQPR
jgi:hypothetical protein